jgi:hypothetical protein
MSIKTVISHLDRDLLNAGFVRKGTTWNRISGNFVDMINAQKSKDGEAFTLNVGVAHRRLYRIFWGKELPPFIDESSCVVRARIGHLLDGKDLWWEFVGAGIEGDLSAKVRIQVLPFLQEMNSLTSMERFLVASDVQKNPYPLPVLYLAIIKHELGRQHDACKLLANRRPKAPSAWQVRIDAVMQRLNCAPPTG